MRTYPTNELEALGGLVPPEMLLLAALLQNQIESLALLWAKGLWNDDPAELGAVSTIREGGASRGLTRRDAVWEWQIWGPATDALIDALEQDTPIRIDRGRILSLARRKGAAMRHGDGRLTRAISR